MEKNIYILCIQCKKVKMHYYCLCKPAIYPKIRQCVLKNMVIALETYMKTILDYPSIIRYNKKTESFWANHKVSDAFSAKR